jgi:EmrB/QacA subfamily drug resistance transporter
VTINPSAAPNPRRWLGLGVLALVQFMLVLDTTVVNVALPSIQRDLGFSPSGLAWVVNAYSLTAGGFLLLGGRVADLIGRKRLFMIGVILFAGASAASGFAQNPGTLVAARFVQGLGEAIASPAALSLAVLLFDDPKERAKAVGAWGGLAGLGGTFGVVIGGVITSEASWRWIFLINLPIAAAVVVIVPRLIPESRVTARGRIDIVGALLITGSLVLIVDGLLAASTHQWGQAAVVLPLVIGGTLMAAFIVSQRIVPNPLVPLSFFRNRTRVSANVATMLSVAAFLSMFFVLTLYMQDVGHYSALKTGLAYLPFGGALLVGIGLSTQVLPRFGVKYGLVIAFLLAAGGLLLLSQIQTHVEFASHVLPGMLLFALGQGIMFPALQNAALHQVGSSDAGLGSGVQNTFLQVGGSLGLAVLVTTALRHANSQVADGVSQLTASTDGYALALRIAAGVALAGAVLVATVFEKVTFVPPEQLAMAAAEAEAGAGEVIAA